MKTILFTLFLVLAAVPAVAQIVERQQGSSTSTETRNGSRQSGGSQVETGVGLFFAKLAMVELQGAEAFGLDVTRSQEAAINYVSNTNNRQDALDLTGIGLMDIMHANCQNFKRKSLTYSHLPAAYNSAANYHGGVNDIVSSEDNDMQVDPPYGSELLAFPVVARKYGPPVKGNIRFGCLVMQTGIIEQALTKLRRGAKGYVSPSEKEINSALLYGFDTWTSSPAAKMLVAAIPNPHDRCLVPTPTGYERGFRTATCGPFEFNMDTRAFLFGGTVMLDQNYVNGRRIIFDESRASESGRSSSRSTSSGTRRGVKVME